MKKKYAYLLQASAIKKFAFLQLKTTEQIMYRHENLNVGRTCRLLNVT